MAGRVPVVGRPAVDVHLAPVGGEALLDPDRVGGAGRNRPRGTARTAPTPRPRRTVRGAGRRSTAAGARAARVPPAAPWRTPSRTGPPRGSRSPGRGPPDAARGRRSGWLAGRPAAPGRSAAWPPRRRRASDVDVERADVLAERDEVVLRRGLDLVPFTLAPELVAKERHRANDTDAVSPPWPGGSGRLRGRPPAGANSESSGQGSPRSEAGIGAPALAVARASCFNGVTCSPRRVASA